MHRSLLIGLGILLLAVAAPAGAGDRWIHVAVDGTDDDPEHVRVNVPLQLVESVLPLIDEAEFHHGKVHMDDYDLDREEIVAMLRAVTEAEDGEYVTVRDDDENVRVRKEGGYILVNVQEGEGRHMERVDIRFPMDVLDALISGEDDELDILAAVRALGEHDDGDLVTVNDAGTTVRIWIDRQNESD